MIKRKRNRFDGRLQNEIRKIKIDFNVLSNSQGSVRYFMGETQIICSVIGPNQISKNINATQNVYYSPYNIKKPKIIVSFKNLNQKVSLENYQNYEVLLTNSLKEIIIGQPQFTVGCGILISIKVIQDDGCILSAAFNAAILALINSGINLRSTYCSLTCGFINFEKQNMKNKKIKKNMMKIEKEDNDNKEDNEENNEDSDNENDENEENEEDKNMTLIVDPTKEEELSSKGWCFFVFDVGQTDVLLSSSSSSSSSYINSNDQQTDGRLLSFYLNGSLNDDQYWDCLKSSRKGCTETISSVLRLSLEKVNLPIFGE